MSPAKNESFRDDFFEYVNHDWLADETITIPPEYPRWGSFTKLADDSLKNQIGLLKTIVSKKPSNSEEEKLAQVWAASMNRFESWENGGGDYSCIAAEFKILTSNLELGSDSSTWSKGLANYFSRCQQIGIKSTLR